MPRSTVPRHLIFRDDEAETVKLQAAAEGGEGAKLRKFSMLAYTGGKLNVGFGRPVVVDLSGLKVSAKSRPILKDHVSSLIVGHTEAVKVNGGSVHVEGVVSGSGAAAQEVVATSDNGFPWQASIGADVETMVTIDEGETVQVNGRKFTGPIYVARKSRLSEVSFVALGADDNTIARVAASAAGPQLEVLTMDFETWLKANGHNDPATLTDEERTTLQAKYDAEQADAADDGKGKKKPVKRKVAASKQDDDQPDNDANVATLQAQVEHLTEQARIAELKVVANGHPAILAQAIRDKWDAQRTELEVLRASRPNVPGIASGSSDHGGAVIEAALCLSAGIPEKKIGEQYGEKVANAALSRDMRGFGIASLLHEVIRAGGGHARPGSVNEDTIRAAFTAERNLQASGGQGFSTVSLSGILGNVASKTMLTAYGAVPSVAEQIARARDVTDFKATASYRLTGKGEFTEVGQDGEIKHVELEEADYANRLSTYAAMIALTRQMMINDDLGAFLEIPRIFGRMAGIRREKQLFTVLLANGGDFFNDDTDENLIHGTANVLSIDALTTATQAFVDRVDSNGDPILLEPSILLVPSSLKVTAELLMAERGIVYTNSSTAKIPAANPWAGKFRVISSPYLNAQSLTGSSATAWYLLADPNDVPALEVIYLRGQRAPVIESGDTNFNTLGMQWRGYLDFGVAFQDPRAAVKVTGVVDPDA